MIKPGYLRWKQGLQIGEVSTIASTAVYTADSAVQQSEALAATAGQVNAPTYDLIPYATTTLITLTCSTPAATIQVKINGGSFSAYSSPFLANEGDTVLTYATAGGLTDSGVVTIYI